MATPPPPSAEQLSAVLLQAFLDKADAEAKVADAEKTIIALRNVLTGMKAEQRRQAEAAQPKT